MVVMVVAVAEDLEVEDAHVVAGRQGRGGDPLQEYINGLGWTSSTRMARPPHTESTILPKCSPRSIRRWAWAASASGKT